VKKSILSGEKRAEGETRGQKEVRPASSALQRCKNAGNARSKKERRGGFSRGEIERRRGQIKNFRMEKREKTERKVEAPPKTNHSQIRITAPLMGGNGGRERQKLEKAICKRLGFWN